MRGEHVALLVLLSALGASSERMVVPFGSGWLYKFGDDPQGSGSGPNTCDFVDVDGMNCTQMEKNPNRFTAVDCHIDCCYNPECMVWQFKDRGCWHGKVDAQCSNHGTKPSPFVGGRRTSFQPFKRDYSYAEESFDDATWTPVSVPHDGMMNQTVSEAGEHFDGYFPRNVSWYRKHFNLPSSFKDTTVYLEFEGVMHYTEVYINGQWVQDHPCGYTEFLVRLDNVTGIRWGGENVISLRADASYGSGHWYEGSGIYREVSLLSLPNLHFVKGGVYASPESDGTAIKLSAEVEDLSASPVSSVAVNFVLKTHVDGTVLGNASVTWSSQGGKASVVSTVLRPSSRLPLWGITTPQNTFILIAYVGSDEVMLLTAARQTSWGKSFSLNGQEVELTGFSHHNSFAGTGVVSSERLNLFRVQTAKAVGSNFWRNSHNPYERHLYDILTHAGLLTWDENRDFGEEYTQEMADMVKNHRSYPNIIIWSFCNEADCGKVLSNDAAASFFNVTKTLDPYRPTTANMQMPSRLPVQYVDVQGFSHGNNNTFQTFHKQYPNMPLILSECCSCTANRVEHRSASQCMAKQNSPVDLPYVTGSIGVWTLMDYFGETPGWPATTSAFGNFDIGGFPKANAWWYRLAWLARRSHGSPSRPAVSDDAHVARVLNLFGDAASSNGTFNGVVSTRSAQLYVDGVNKGVQTAASGGGVSWHADVSTARNATILAVGDQGNVVARHTVLRCKGVAAVQLVVDVPSRTTGTGSKLYLDGRDTALVRVQLVDSDGVVCTGDSDTRRVAVSVSGGSLVGLGAGPASHLPAQGSIIDTYGGLARIVAKVDVDCTSRHRGLAPQVDVMTGPIRFLTSCPSPLPPLTVTATVEGLPKATITIPTSGDLADSPMEVARANAVLQGYTYMDDITA